MNVFILGFPKWDLERSGNEKIAIFSYRRAEKMNE